MKQYIKDNHCPNMAKIEAFFQKRLLDQKKLFKIKLSSIDCNSNYKTISTFKSGKIKNKVFEDSKNNNYNFTIQNERIIPKLLKKSPKKTKRILSYRERTNNKYNFDSTVLKYDLRRYTNNSNTFKYFNELNKDYHPYTVNKAIKSILFQNNKEKEKEPNEEKSKISTITSLLYNNSKKEPKKKIFFRNSFSKPKKRFFKKKLSKLFNIINPSLDKVEKISENKKEDLELRDKVDIKFFENNQLQKSIKNALIHDINNDESNNKLYLNFLNPINNRVNFQEDIYIVPHIQNNLYLCKIVDNLDLLNDKLTNKNLLHKYVGLSMNRICITKILLKMKRELEMKKLKEKNDYQSKIKWNSNNDESFERKFAQFEKNFEHFELTDYFEKGNNYTIIGLANQKLKNTIFNKNFLKE